MVKTLGPPGWFKPQCQGNESRRSFWRNKPKPAGFGETKPPREAKSNQRIKQQPYRHVRARLQSRRRFPAELRLIAAKQRPTRLRLRGNRQATALCRESSPLAIRPYTVRAAMPRRCGNRPLSIKRNFCLLHLIRSVRRGVENCLLRRSDARQGKCSNDCSNDCGNCCDFVFRVHVVSPRRSWRRRPPMRLSSPGVSPGRDLRGHGGVFHNRSRPNGIFTPAKQSSGATNPTVSLRARRNTDRDSYPQAFGEMTCCMREEAHYLKGRLGLRKCWRPRDRWRSRIFP